MATRTRIAVAAVAIALPLGLTVVPVQAATDTLDWQPCHERAANWNDYLDSPDEVTECTLLNVPLDPLDYANPNGRKIQLAVSRIKATDQKHRRGVLVINPGGPGGHGVDKPVRVSRSRMKDLGTVYDLIGFDPRGAQYSDKIVCQPLVDLFMDPVYSTAPDRKSRAKEASDAHAKAANSCVNDDPDFAKSLTTETVARDVDSIRVALGEDKISFLGESWGTALGAVYRSLFDGNVDRMLLDSVVTPGNPITRYEDVHAAEQAMFKRYAAWLAKHHDDYGFGRTESAVVTALAALEKVQGWDENTMVDRAAQGGTANWVHSTQELVKIRDGKSPRAAKPAQSLGYDGEDLLSDTLFMFTAGNCNDVKVGRSFEAVWAQALKLESAYPLAPKFAVDEFGNIDFTRCVDWSVDAQPPRLTKGKSALQLVGHRYETRTPYVWAEKMQDAIGGSLLTVKDDKHVSLEDIPCASKAVAFFLHGTTFNCACDGVPEP